MKEYHLHKSPLPNGAEQVIIASAVRNDEEQTISVGEIFIITRIGNIEIKSRIDIENLIERVIKTPGGNIPIENYDKMYEIIDPVTPEEVQLQNQVDMYQHQFNPNEPVTNDLIFAADMAAACHSTDFDSIVEELLNANTTHNK